MSDDDIDGTTRRNVLQKGALLGSALAMGAIGGAAGDTGNGATSASVGALQGTVYQWSSGPDANGYAGPNSGRSNVSPDTGDVYIGWDNGAETLWRGDGSSWVQIADFSNIGTGSGSLTTSDETLLNGSARGALIIDGSGDYVGATSDDVSSNGPWTSSTDAGTVLQSLVDDLATNSGGNNLGVVRVGAGNFEFQTPVVFDNHRGVTIEGQSFKQSNNQWGTQFAPGSGLPTGRAILEFGNVGSDAAPGSASACHVRNIYADLGDADKALIFNWRQDRLRLTDVKADNPGQAYHSIIYCGSFNSSWHRVYADQSAILKYIDQADGSSTKNTNSTRLFDVTMNANFPSVPSFLMSGDGWRMENVFVNTHDGTGGLDTDVGVLEGRASKGFLETHPNVTSGQYDSEGVYRFIANDLDVLGVDDTLVGGGMYQCQVVNGRFRDGADPISVGSDTHLSNCEFSEQTGRMIELGDSNTNRTSITNCWFETFSQGGSTNEPAIWIQDNLSYEDTIITGCTFIDNQGTAADIVAQNNAEGYHIAGNTTPNGISETFGGALVGGSEDTIPLIQGNKGYNPVGKSRPTPSTPAGTGSTNSVDNPWAEGAWVYHDGTGVTVTEYGSDVTYNTDPSPVFVPRHGEIYFTGSAPSNWDWYWE